MTQVKTMVFDRKSKLLLMLGMLNDVYGDTASIVLSLQDFISSHPEMEEEVGEFKLISILNKAKEFEELILDTMDRIKVEVYL